MNELFIRKASMNDVEALRVFEQNLIATEREFDNTIISEPISYYNLEEMIQSPDVQILVAQIKKRIVACGYAYIMNSKPHLKHRKFAHLGFMYVEPNYRGKGVNASIIDNLKDWALSKGVTELRLEVYSGNKSAIRAYEKSGFKQYLIEMKLSIV